MSVSAATFAWVADTVRARSAITLTPGKEYLVEARLTPLARAATGGDIDAYVARARAGDAGATVAIVEALTTNETSWFRDVGPFAALRSAIAPALAAARPASGPLTIWSAACSTGQEPYSIAMVLADALPSTTRFSILATDLSTQVLERARTGRYSQLEVNRGLPAASMVRHMSRVGTEWQVDPALAAHVQFRQHNLLSGPPAGQRFDVVFLRNVLIYFDVPTKVAILSGVRRAMAPDGYLLLGSAETTLGLTSEWTHERCAGTSVYRPTPAPTTRGGVTTKGDA